MKKRGKILVYILLAFAALSATGAITIGTVGNTLDKESKIFVDTAIPAIVSDWDIAEIQKRASPEFNEAVDYDEMQQLLEVLHGLGDFQEYNGSVGESRIIISLQSGVVITAYYDASADFESGSAVVQISLIKHGNKWQILGFKVVPGESNESKDFI
ncbi:MAG TPA: hypothetical protein VLX29_02355 [Nitrospirota bacterium]|nr:hypothetical protein [Nitrospirota bacterium]